MKKLALVLVLAVIISVGAFAQHPSGWGVGGGYQYGGGWEGGDPGSTLTLFLKAPSMPIYWGIGLNILDWEFTSNYTYFGLSVTGDSFLIHDTLVPDVGLSWFLGVGGYLEFHSFSGSNWSRTGLGFGVRVPIGLSIMPIENLEFFLSVAPSICLNIELGDFADDPGLGGGWQTDIGFRFWF